MILGNSYLASNFKAVTIKIGVISERLQRTCSLWVMVWCLLHTAVDYNFNTFIGEIFLEQIKICAVLCLLLLQKVCIALVEVCAVIFEQLDMKLNLGSGRKNVNINCRFNVSWREKKKKKVVVSSLTIK